MKRWIIITVLIASMIALASYLTFYYWQPVKKTEAALQIVEVKKIEPRKVSVWSEFSARLQAVAIAEIRPEVSGRITEVRFEDGALVKEQDVLFVIDPRPYEAAFSKAEAQLATAVANAQFSKIEMERAQSMIKTKAIAQRIYDERYNSNQVAIAAIKSAKAELKKATVDLDHAYLKAPISGRVGRIEITLGNIVQAGPNAPLLTRIVTYDPIYADFEVDEQTYMKYVRNVANALNQEQRIPVELSVQNDNKKFTKGYIYTFDNQLSQGTGTIRARAKFDNPDSLLVPGMFVSIKLSEGEQNVILVPQSAISYDQSKKYVYIVDKNNQVVYREIEVGKEVNSERIVLKGLENGDLAVVNGIQKIKPGQTVQVKVLE